MRVSASTVVSVAERPAQVRDIQRIDAIAFPTFMAHTDLASLWPAVYEAFPDSLPRSAVEMVSRALHDQRLGRHPTAVGALQAVVHPEHQGAGHSAQMLQAMAAHAARIGAGALFAPIRPTLEARYPLVSLDSYVDWKRSDGQIFDPWQRVHARLGATQAGIVECWLTVNASPAAWSHWSGLTFPVSGTYVVPGALQPIDVNLECDTGTYVEPHLWMHYRLT